MQEKTLLLKRVSVSRSAARAERLLPSGSACALFRGLRGSSSVFPRCMAPGNGGTHCGRRDFAAPAGFAVNPELRAGSSAAAVRAVEECLQLVFLPGGDVPGQRRDPAGGGDWHQAPTRHPRGAGGTGTFVFPGEEGEGGCPDSFPD